MRRFGITIGGAALALLWLACSGGSGPVGGGLGGFVSCSSDDQCPGDQGCQVDTPAGDGYCSPLCSTNADCPGKYACPSLVQQQAGDCDDLGKHKGGRGACEQFTRSRGPQTCSSAPADNPPETVTDAATNGG